MFPPFPLQAVMGVFFYTKSVALVEDVPLEEKYESESSLLRDMEAGYEQVLIIVFNMEQNIKFKHFSVFPPFHFRMP